MYDKKGIVVINQKYDEIKEKRKIIVFRFSNKGEGRVHLSRTIGLTYVLDMKSIYNKYYI